jgi:hypothetical protein
LALAFALVAAIVAVPAVSAAATKVPAQPPAHAIDLPIHLPGTIAGVAGAFDGTLSITKFIVKDGQVLAQGVLNGDVTQTIGGVTTTVGHLTNFKVNLPFLDPPPAACDILHLTLGPIHLDLLGLVVDLNQVQLDITAVPGAGNLLGNLLCALTGLLDQGLTGLVNDLVGVLNKLIKQL